MKLFAQLPKNTWNDSISTDILTQGEGEQALYIFCSSKSFSVSDKYTDFGGGV